MSVHRQENGWYYATCVCGVCGPVRAYFVDAVRDERTHASVCSNGGKR